MQLVDPKPLGDQPNMALILSQSVQGFADLPNVPQEVGEVHQIEGGKQILNDAFTEARFGAELRSTPYNIVHIASHGQFDVDPKQTIEVKWDKKKDKS
jgi:CHAT domain-containing protein